MTVHKLKCQRIRNYKKLACYWEIILNLTIVAYVVKAWLIYTHLMRDMLTKIEVTVYCDFQLYDWFNFGMLVEQRDVHMNMTSFCSVAFFDSMRKYSVLTGLSFNLDSIIWVKTLVLQGFSLSRDCWASEPDQDMRVEMMVYNVIGRYKWLCIN